MIHDCKLSQFVHPNVAALYYVDNFWQIIAGTLITEIQNAPPPPPQRHTFMFDLQSNGRRERHQM